MKEVEIPAHLSALIDTLRSWLLDHALPLWQERGFDAATDCFHERLDHAGDAINSAPRRLMTQARQIFVYAHGTLLGWTDGRDIVRKAFDAMVGRYYRADGEPGWIFSVDVGGRIVDTTRDLYGHAFVLLALASYFRLVGDSEALVLADATLLYIDETMPTPWGGYFDSIGPRAAKLRQNPHMHLFEALLALYEATRRVDYLARANKIYDLLQAKLFVPGADIVAEYFDEGWVVQGDGKAIWEPGHHLEWAWLLNRYEQLSQRQTGALADAILRRAYRDGISPQGIIPDEMRADGTAATESHRPWPLTEAAKINAVRHEQGDRAGAERATAVLECLYGRFLSPAAPGLWFDHLSAGWEPLHDYVPASTLYHLLLGIAEVDRVFGNSR